MKLDIKTWAIVSLLVLFAGSLLYGQCQKRAFQDEKRNLINELAERDKTIEISKGVFVKLTRDISDLQSLLDNSNAQVHALSEQIELQRQRIVGLTEAVVKWKKAYEAALDAVQVPPDIPPTVPPECVDSCGKIRTKVEFKKDFGYILVTGHTITNPAEGHVKVEQVRPLVLTLALTAGSDGKWKTFVASSEDNIEVDIKLSAIDLSFFEPKWYEKIALVGSASVGHGLSSNVGLTYDVGSISVGPTYGWSTDGPGQTFGLTVAWRPFKR